MKKLRALLALAAVTGLGTFAACSDQSPSLTAPTAPAREANDTTPPPPQSTTNNTTCKDGGVVVGSGSFTCP